MKPDNPAFTVPPHGYRPRNEIAVPFDQSPKLTDPPPTITVGDTLALMDHNNDNLNHLTEQLEKLLAPILRPAAPQGANALADPREQADCELAERLVHRASTHGQANERLRALVARIALNCN